MQDIKVAVIGLDTSHAIEFPRRMQAPDCPADQKVAGLRAVNCLRFETPFQNEDGLTARQKTLEGWGVKVTRSFDEAVAGCDALMLEINDPAFHWEYFQKCVKLGKPMFLDKPLADTTANGRKIVELAKAKQARVFSTSSVRFTPQVAQACAQMPAPLFAQAYGPLGAAPAGSGIVWYGVHTFEILERAMGRGARSVWSKKDAAGVTCIVDYPDARRGVVELNLGAWVWGGCLRTKEKAVPFVVDMTRGYSDLLLEVGKFFRGGPAPVALDDTLEVMALLDAAQRSADSGREESL
jgi:hypothetical protein